MGGMLPQLWCALVMISFFFFNDTATTEIYTLSLHDALPIWFQREATAGSFGGGGQAARTSLAEARRRQRGSRG